MFTIDLINAIFIACMAIGGILLLLVVLLDDLLGGLLDVFDFDFDFGGVSVLPVGLGFMAMFGVGGILGLELFGLSPTGASLVGVAAGGLGAGLVFVMFNFLSRNEADQPFTLRDLIGNSGRVSVGAAAGRTGVGIFSHSGLTHSMSISASVDLISGTAVRVTDVAGTTLIVEPLMADAAKE